MLSERGRQRRARSSISKSFVFANRVVGAFVSSQIKPARAPRSNQFNHPGHQGQPDRASRGQIEPARAPGAVRSSQSRPDRASLGEAGRAGWAPKAARIFQLDSSSSNFVMDGLKLIPNRPRFDSFSMRCLVRRVTCQRCVLDCLGYCDSNTESKQKSIEQSDKEIKQLTHILINGDT